MRLQRYNFPFTILKQKKLPRQLFLFLPEKFIF